MGFSKKKNAFDFCDVETLFRRAEFGLSWKITLKPKNFECNSLEIVYNEECMLLLSRTITCITIKSYRTSTQGMRSTFSISFIFLRRNPGQKSPLAMTENHANDVSFHWFWVDIQIKVRKGIKGLYSTHSMGFMKIHFHSPFIANDKNISPKHDMKWRQNKQQRKHGGGGWNVPNLWAFFFGCLFDLFRFYIFC